MNLTVFVPFTVILCFHGYLLSAYEDWQAYFRKARNTSAYYFKSNNRLKKREWMNAQY